MIIETVYAAITLPGFTETQDFGGFIRSLYVLAISVVGLAVFIQFLRAGFSYLIGAAGNAAETSNAKHMMTNAVIGAVLLLSAYLILNVINPDLTKTNFVFILPTPPPTPTMTAEPTPPRISNKDKLKEFGVTVLGGDIEKVPRETINKIVAIAIECKNSNGGYNCNLIIIDTELRVSPPIGVPYPGPRTRIAFSASPALWTYLTGDVGCKTYGNFGQYCYNDGYNTVFVQSATIGQGTPWDAYFPGE